MHRSAYRLSLSGGRTLGKIIFIGLGLTGEGGITLTGLERAKQADKIYIELYTSLIPQLSVDRLERLLGKPVILLSRVDLEEHPELNVLKDASTGVVAFLVSGDPMIATTHIDLRLRAWKMGITTEVVNGVSIHTAAPAASGLQIYKFSRTVTIPFPSDIYKPDTPYDVIKDNTVRGLHTLVLLDLNVELRRYMTIKEGLEYLLNIEDKRGEEVVTPRRLAIAVAGVGSNDPMIKGDTVERLVTYRFEALPHTLIFPGKLHFMETEALRVFASTPKDAIGNER